MRSPSTHALTWKSLACFRSVDRLDPDFITPPQSRVTMNGSRKGRVFCDERKSLKIESPSLPVVECRVQQLLALRGCLRYAMNPV